MLHFEIPPFSTPPRIATLNMSLESDNEGEDQEVLDNLEYEEQEVIQATPKDNNELNFLSGLADSLPDVSSDEEDPLADLDHSVQVGGGSGDIDSTPFCVPCEGNVCDCGRQLASTQRRKRFGTTPPARTRASRRK